MLAQFTEWRATSAPGAFAFDLEWNVGSFRSIRVDVGLLSRAAPACSAGFALAGGHAIAVHGFARLHVTDPSDPDWRHRVELVANWPAQPPVQMDIGPVLHLDDVMAGKMDALYNRAAARDFLDVDAAITSGRYTLDQLCELAHDADAGFDRQLFAPSLFGSDPLAFVIEVASCGRRDRKRHELGQIAARPGRVSRFG